MKKNNKKGFTLVELIIVIAVIAILIAVLVPTFAGVIAKANKSADEQEASNLRTAIIVSLPDEKGSLTFDDYLSGLYADETNATEASADYNVTEQITALLGGDLTLYVKGVAAITVIKEGSDNAAVYALRYTSAKGNTVTVKVNDITVEKL